MPTLLQTCFRGGDTHTSIGFSLSFLDNSLCLLPGFCTFCLFDLKIVSVRSHFVFICSLVVSNLHMQAHAFEQVTCKNSKNQGLIK